MARETVEANVEFNTVTLGKYLGVSQQTAHRYVGDILAKRRAERAVISYRSSLLGWSQKEIAEATEVGQQQIGTDLRKIQEVVESVKSQLADGHSIQEVAERHGLPLDLAYAIKMDGMDDLDRCSELDIKIQPYDVWQFSSCHDLMGDSHPGRIPGRLICHVLYFFTKAGEGNRRRLRHYPWRLS